MGEIFCGHLGQIPFIRRGRKYENSVGRPGILILHEAFRLKQQLYFLPKLSNNWQLAALSDASSGGKYENVTGQNGFSTLHFLPDMMVITITKYCNCGQDDCHDDGEDKTNDAGHSVLDQGFSYTL